MEQVMENAIRLHSFGAPQAMRMERTRIEEPAPNQVRVRHTAIGLNYLDIYHRQGDYPLSLPTGLGVAGAGIVEAIGSAVTEVRVGDRVAYAGVPPGSYAESRVVAADRLVAVPEDIEDDIAAATLQQGVTARFLLKDVYKVRAGDHILFHAAAGGLGTIACQWATALGAEVIGTVSSAVKAEHAGAHGCKHVIINAQEQIASRVKDITGGAGVQVVYDSVGKDTWEQSIRSLAMRGTMVSFGSASGPVPLIDVNQISELGSLYLTRPRFVHYTRQRKDLVSMAGDYFRILAEGKVHVRIEQRYALADVAQAHADMEARKTVGSSVLIP